MAFKFSMPCTVTIKNDGVAALAVSPEIGAAVLAHANRAKAIAISFSAPFTQTGHYISSFETRTEIRNLPKGHAHNVIAGVLVNTASYSLGVEYGYEGRSAAPTRTAHKVLSRTAAAISA